MPSWRIASARAIGTSHAKVGLPCQDSLVVQTLPGGRIVAAIADGAGSALLAEQGAVLATEALAGAVSAALAIGNLDFESVLLGAATIARDAISAEADRANRKSSDFACTLLAVIVDEAKGAALQIGDGVILVAEEGQPWNWVFWPQRGAYVNTTRFLTDVDALESLEVKPLSQPVVDFALMSDGLEPLALHYATSSAYQPFLNSLLRPLLKTQDEEEAQKFSTVLQAFLGSEQVVSRTDDDLSLVLATRRFSIA